MRKVLGFSLLAVVSLSGGRGCHVKSLREPAPTIKETVPRKLEDIAFNGNAFLWLLTSQKSILFTTDRGKTWERVPHPGREATGRAEFERIAFPDEYNGWAVTSDGAVCQTTDRGRHWEKIAELEIPNEVDFGPVLQITFVDKQHGWIVDPFNAWKTDDGGIHWKDCPVGRQPQVDGLFAGVYFYNTLAGWIHATRGKIWRTTDGGETWHSQAVAADDQDILPLFFAGERVGWMATRGGKDVNGIYKTNDGGVSWFLQQFPDKDSHIRSIHFVSEAEGWLAGGGAAGKPASSHPIEGVLLHTTDGGASWERVRVNSEVRWFESVFFADSLHGWVVSLDQVYATDDAGKTWYLALGATGGAL